MTMRELAKLANVSPSTVSKAFKDADDVSEETKKLVFDIAKEHGCYHKFYTGKYTKPVIAIICPEVKSGYYAKHIEILQEIISQNKCMAVISSDGFDKEKQAELIEYYSTYLKVDGIIVFNMYDTFKKGYAGTPIVGMFISHNIDIDSVTVDMESAITDAVNHLYESGHTRIAFIGEKLTRQKSECFCKRAEQLRLEHTVITANGRFEQAGEDGASQVLALKNRPTGIVCAYDDIALGVIRALKKSGYGVPEDFSVIGMDNIRACDYFETSLTSIDSCPDEICMIAWDLLEKKRKNKFYRLSQKIIIKPKLVIRETTSKRQQSIDKTYALSNE